MVCVQASRFVAALVTCVFTLMCLAIEAEASVNIPLLHWAYQAIERLTALGVIEQTMVVTKPYSRMQAARAVAQGLTRIRANVMEDDKLEAVAEPLLEQLVLEFLPELQRLGALARPPGRRPSGNLRFGGQWYTEVSSFQVGVGEVRFRENRGGEYYADGTQVQTDVRAWAEFSDWAALTVQPKVISNQQVLGAGVTERNEHVYMREFTLKLTAFNVSLEAGRGTQWWGPGYHGSLLLTNHAFPLDMIKLGTEEPFRLPSFLAPLGQWKVNSFLSQLDHTRDFDRAKVFGLRVSYLPTSWLELGAARLTLFGGAGRNQSFPNSVVKAYIDPPNQSGTEEVNEQVMLDFRARIPSIPYLIPFPGGLQIYGELGSEDKWSKLPLPSRAAFLAGIYIPQLFAGSTTDLRIEYADTDFTRRKTSDHLAGVWYNNGTYTSGMRYRGFPLGHHMGTDGIDFFVRSTRFLTEHVQLGSNLNYQERNRGLPVHERRYEAAADLTWWYSPTVQIGLNYVHQRIYSPGTITTLTPYGESFPANVVSTNHFVWTSLTMSF
jgi:hypothetical protein